MSPGEDLVQTLDLEPIELNLFRGHNADRNRERLYGGQVIAQALVAAYRTVEGRACHSLHAYFIRPGDPKVPVLYQVDRARDGKSFTTRRVVAIQHGEQIFNLAASFQITEPGLEHQTPMPEAPPPESVPDEKERFAEFIAKLPPERAGWWTRERPIEMRPVDPQQIFAPVKLPATQKVWFRVRDPVGDDLALNQCLLAYASDMSLLGTAMRPHGISWETRGVQSASLDHAIWFHHPMRVNDWHLFDQDSPSASGARGFNRGSIYSQAGVLVASVVQEGLIRYRPPASGAAA